jgi:transposase
VAVKWLGRFEQDSSREPVGHGGHRSSKLMPHWDFLEPARTEKPDLTLQALCDRLLVERGVNAETSMMGRFFRRLGVTFKRKTATFLNALRIMKASKRPVCSTAQTTANGSAPIPNNVSCPPVSRSMS